MRCTWLCSLKPGVTMKTTQIPKDFLCVSCAKGKLIAKPSFLKLKAESSSFLQRLQGDICGPINPLSGPFRYFMVIIDASTKWIHVCLLSTRNHTFAKFIAQIIHLCVSFRENRIQSIRMDNAREFTSKAFNDYCLALGINVEHSVPHVHTQNGLAESLIKRIKFIARPLLQDRKLLTSCWGHAVLHAAALIQYRPSAYHSASPHQLTYGQQPVVLKGK
jgi:transposase InsO family protein